eukprot:3117319-Amphidinium_carterae.1
MDRFSSLIRRSITMQEVKCLSPTFCPLVPAEVVPCATLGPTGGLEPPPGTPVELLGCSSNSSLRTSAGCRNFRRWKHRMVNAIRSRTVLEGA